MTSLSRCPHKWDMPRDVAYWVSCADFLGESRVEAIKRGIRLLWMGNHANAPWNRHWCSE